MLASICLQRVTLFILVIYFQKVLNLVKKTTFWEFRMDYVGSLGAALHNARYVELLSVDPALIADAVNFISVSK